MSYWWCLEHKNVEHGGDCPTLSTSRLGPYDNHERAASAMDRVHEREAENEAADRAEEGKK